MSSVFFFNFWSGKTKVSFEEVKSSPWNFFWDATVCHGSMPLWAIFFWGKVHQGCSYGAASGLLLGWSEKVLDRTLRSVQMYLLLSTRRSESAFLMWTATSTREQSQAKCSGPSNGRGGKNQIVRYTLLNLVFPSIGVALHLKADMLIRTGPMQAAWDHLTRPWKYLNKTHRHLYESYTLRNSSNINAHLRQLL